MAEPYLTVLKSIVERSCPPHEEVGDVACKHFFSGAAAYANSHIFMTLTSVGLALKLPEDDRTTLLAEGATLLRYFAKSPVKRDYVVLPSELVDDNAGLMGWISSSIKFVEK